MLPNVDCVVGECLTRGDDAKTVCLFNAACAQFAFSPLQTSKRNYVSCQGDYIPFQFGQLYNGGTL